MFQTLLLLLSSCYNDHNVIPVNSWKLGYKILRLKGTRMYPDSEIFLLHNHANFISTFHYNMRNKIRKISLVWEWQDMS